MNDLSLEGKDILFFCPKTFGYEKEIIYKLESLGANVTFHSILPTEHPWFKGITRVIPRAGLVYSDYYFKKWIENYSPEKCDIVFIVKGEGISPSVLALIKRKYSNAKMVLHLWDSLSNCSLIEKKLQYFDSMSSFDAIDCLVQPCFRYRPLFFLDKYLCSSVPLSKPGIFFLGTLNGDRPKVIRKVIENISPEINFDYWLFVRNSIEFSLRKLVDPCLRAIDSSRFLFKPMSFEIIYQHMQNCSAVLDIEHPNQTGLTMRTMEVLASGKKLITTNSHIKEHDFFDPDRILIVDRCNPLIPKGFIEKECPAVPESFKIEYSLERWCEDVLSV